MQFQAQVVHTDNQLESQNSEMSEVVDRGTMRERPTEHHKPLADKVHEYNQVQQSQDVRAAIQE